ncbi:trafficking protein particle complex subunit 4-like [Hydractinia symbiolongicarpus]|uniref:trafficking protein particle complex subunit 4-like n=1 Tax=Hydractinia symbiolongicarpus TaxID=13093 RepID=UPI002549E327|nr:trafficking protein particle complex subunit 4-like [Hydractinia symbiolongicarpus]
MSGYLYSVYVINKAGGLIYQRDYSYTENEVEQTFKHPLGLVLKEVDDKLVVLFGEKDGVKVGHSLLGVNGETLNGKVLHDGTSVLNLLNDESKFPITLRFGKPKLSTNERIMLASMFHSLFAISCKLSPAEKSSGIELLETNSFKLHCMQSITGVKFLVLTDPRVLSMDAFLKKLYELYSDFALKNPFFSLEMPIRCDLFDTNLQKLLEQTEKSINHTMLST